MFFWILTNDTLTANRSLEDIDAYYRDNPSLIVAKDPDTISYRRPSKYIEKENIEIERAKAHSKEGATQFEKRSKAWHPTSAIGI